MTTTQRSLYGVAVLIAACGFGAFVWAIQNTITADASTTRLLLFVVLTTAAIVSSRFQIKLGVKSSFISLDCIPMVLAVLLLPTSDAILIGVVTSFAAMFGQPIESGWAGRFWRWQPVLSGGLALGIISEFAKWLLADPMPGVVLAVPAFVVALALELIFDLFLLVEFEATEPGSGRSLLDALVVPAANVFLPAVSTAMLTPYVAKEPWEFALLLPVLLVGMYGALWVANSQQLEKRRGERLKDTFSRYVPEGVIDDNLESMQQIKLGGEQRDVSVMFCDIRGFTSWAEDKGATEVITELNVLLTELSASVMETGGTLDKFTGDGLMAFWGAPVPVEDHADRACRAALDMLQRLHRVNTRRLEDGQEPFAIGVAVNSGLAVVGNVGHERRLDYTAIGDTVNTTARLEASTKEIGAVLLISRATVDLLGEDLRERAMRVGDVTMRGKVRPVEAWALRPLRPELDDVDDEFAA